MLLPVSVDGLHDRSFAFFIVKWRGQRAHVSQVPNPWELPYGT